jgi:hypothetical protein
MRKRKLNAGRLEAVLNGLTELERRGVYIPAALSEAVKDVEEGVKRLLVLAQWAIDAHPALGDLWDEARGLLAVYEDETK